MNPLTGDLPRGEQLTGTGQLLKKRLLGQGNNSQHVVDLRFKVLAG